MLVKCGIILYDRLFFRRVIGVGEMICYNSNFKLFVFDVEVRFIVRDWIG